MLQTLRSRCVEMKLRPVRKETEEDEQAREEAEALCRLLAAGRRNTIAEHMARLEKQRLKREEVGRMVAELLFHSLSGGPCASCSSSPSP